MKFLFALLLFSGILNAKNGHPRRRLKPRRSIPAPRAQYTPSMSTLMEALQEAEADTYAEEQRREMRKQNLLRQIREARQRRDRREEERLLVEYNRMIGSRPIAPAPAPRRKTGPPRHRRLQFESVAPEGLEVIEESEEPNGR